jgi:hypothetical protein
LLALDLRVVAVFKVVVVVVVIVVAVGMLESG